MTIEKRSITFDVEQGAAPLRRIDQYLSSQWADLSRSRIQSLIKAGHILVNHRTVSPSVKLKPGDMIDLKLPVLIEPAPKAQAVDFEVIYEDYSLLVINKPVGLVVHPGAGNPDQTLVNGLLHYCAGSLSGIGGERRPGIVHRLDKGTSGLLVVAKTDQAHQYLSSQFHDRTLSRRYSALVWGMPLALQTVIDGNIGRDFHHRQKMKVLVHGGKPATTEYTVIEKVGTRASLIKCQLRTGRTHQIRVHMAFKGHGLIGDPLYGQAPRGLNPIILKEIHRLTQEKQRPCLHAEYLSFVHPDTQKKMRFHCDWPSDFQEIYNYLQTV